MEKFAETIEKDSLKTVFFAKSKWIRQNHVISALKLRNIIEDEKRLMGILIFSQESICSYKFKVRGAYDKFPDFFHMDIFIDSKRLKL